MSLRAPSGERLHSTAELIGYEQARLDDRENYPEAHKKAQSIYSPVTSSSEIAKRVEIMRKLPGRIGQFAVIEVVNLAHRFEMNRQGPIVGGYRTNPSPNMVSETEKQIERDVEMFVEEARIKYA